MAQQLVQVTWVRPSDVQEAFYNVNVMPPEKYSLLKADMKLAGPEGTDPIHTCVLEGKKWTCDGAHRLRAARELAWPRMQEVFHPEITTEEQARLFNYKRDFERGDIDPFKLAASFKWFVDQGFKQEQIAEKYGVDKSTVSRRLSLLGLTPEVKKQVTTDTQFSVSSIEPIASLPVALQKVAVKEVKQNLDRGRPLSSREVQEVVNEVKEEDRKEQAFRKALEDPRVKTEFKKCPKCKESPNQFVNDSWYLWPGAVLVVRDQNYHTWCLVTGPKPEEKREYHRSSGGSSRPPQHEKSKVKYEVYQQAIRNFFDAVWPKLTDITYLFWTGVSSKTGKAVTFTAGGLESISASGKVDGRKVTLNVNTNSVTFGNVDFLFEKNRTSNKGFETYVKTSSQMSTRKALHALEEGAVDFLEEYGKLPRGNNPDWLRIQKREARK